MPTAQGWLPPPRFTQGQVPSMCASGSPNSIHELQLKIPQSGDFAATVRRGKTGWSEDTLPGVSVSLLMQVSGCPRDKDFNHVDIACLMVALC